MNITLIIIVCICLLANIYLTFKIFKSNKILLSRKFSYLVAVWIIPIVGSLIVLGRLKKGPLEKLTQAEFVQDDLFNPTSG